ncbi:MAG: hypothetical protein NT037_18205 [Hyphomicrobiales bacterium]|nr:hypothetical protein [Hyphomicrobiales bacterium]
MICRGHIRFCTAFVLAALLLLLPGHQQSLAEEWTRVALTNVDGRADLILSSPDGRRFAYLPLDGATPVALPTDFVPQARLHLDSGRWLLLGRIALVGDLAAVVVDGRTATRLLIEPHIASRLYLFHGFKALGNAFLVAYDVEAMIASGRSSKVVKDGVDLFVLDIFENELRLKKIADKMQLAGIDARYTDQQLGNAHILCAQAACLVMSRDTSGELQHVELRRPEWAPRSLVELTVSSGSLRGLFRLDFDDRFRAPPVAGEIIYAECGIWPEGGCKDLPADQLPLGYRPDGGIAAAETCADVETIARKDLLAMPGHGLTYVGMNNHEGRIPWGQIYVLDGMLDVIERLALPQKRFDALRSDMRQRVAMELAWWGLLTQTKTPWLWSRRYSLERADIVSLVHIGRMTRVVGRAESMGLDTPSALQRALAEALTRHDIALEQVKDNQLVYRKGSPFYLDGSNVPWNYQSGWVEGLAAMATFGAVDDASRVAATAMVYDFIKVEIVPRKPDIWQYCAGPCQDGWKSGEGVSVNTPEWEGNKTRTSTAHTSYRAMDARAVLEAMATWKIDGLEWFPRYVKGLVERGWLYPMTMAPLAKHGLRPKLGAAEIASFGRSTIPFDVHNQLWALDAMAAKPGMCE